jgi:hypothetical protein
MLIAPTEHYWTLWLALPTWLTVFTIMTGPRHHRLDSIFCWGTESKYFSLCRPRAQSGMLCDMCIIRGDKLSQLFIDKTCFLWIEYIPCDTGLAVRKPIWEWRDNIVLYWGVKWVFPIFRTDTEVDLVMLNSVEVLCSPLGTENSSQSGCRNPSFDFSSTIYICGNCS